MANPITQIIRDAGGIVHSDGNIFFTSAAQFLAAARTLQAAGQAEQPQEALTADSLYEAIKHGDEKHRAWLKGALEDSFAGRPIRREAAAPTQAEQPAQQSADRVGGLDQ